MSSLKKKSSMLNENLGIQSVEILSERSGLKDEDNESWYDKESPSPRSGNIEPSPSNNVMKGVSQK